MVPPSGGSNPSTPILPTFSHSIFYPYAITRGAYNLPMTDIKRDALLFTGSSHPTLAQEIAAILKIPLGKISLKQFPDGEINIEILESVRGRDVFVVQSVALKPNHYLMELLIIIDALKRASAKSITAVIPYFGYCRQDRKNGARVPITAKLVANLLETSGATHVLTMDLHAPQVQGFFDIPVDNIHAGPAMLDEVAKLELNDLVAVTPDIGSVKLARSLAKEMGAEYVIIDKSRISPTEVEVVSLIGNVKGKNVLLADDICSTAGTLVSAAKACHEEGAKRIFAVVTHGIFVSGALEKIDASPIEALLISNTIPSISRSPKSSKLISVSVAALFAHAIDCIASAESISSPCNTVCKAK